MLRSLTALALASAAASPAATIPAKPAIPARPGSPTAPHSASDALSTSPWWERITVTISGDGKPQACKYESSVKPAHSCDVVGSEAAEATSSSTSASSSAKAEYTRITFERRFQPGAQPKADDLQPGETLLGGQVMALGIDPHGLVKACKIVSESGSMKPEYGGEQAKTEHFEASAATPRAAAEREGYMTVVVYGHSEHVV